MSPSLRPISLLPLPLLLLVARTITTVHAQSGAVPRATITHPDTWDVLEVGDEFVVQWELVDPDNVPENCEYLLDYTTQGIGDEEDEWESQFVTTLIPCTPTNTTWLVQPDRRGRSDVSGRLEFKYDDYKSAGFSQSFRVRAEIDKTTTVTVSASESEETGTVSGLDTSTDSKDGGDGTEGEDGREGVEREQQQEEDTAGGLGTAGIAGIAVATTVVALSSISALIWWLRRRRRQRKPDDNSYGEDPTNTLTRGNRTMMEMMDGEQEYAVNHVIPELDGGVVSAAVELDTPQPEGGKWQNEKGGMKAKEGEGERLIFELDGNHNDHISSEAGLGR